MNINEIMTLIEELTSRVQLLEIKVAALNPPIK